MELLIESWNDDLLPMWKGGSHLHFHFLCWRAATKRVNVHLADQMANLQIGYITRFKINPPKNCELYKICGAVVSHHIWKHAHREAAFSVVMRYEWRYLSAWDLQIWIRFTCSVIDHTIEEWYAKRDNPETIQKIWNRQLDQHRNGDRICL